MQENQVDDRRHDATTSSARSWSSRRRTRSSTRAPTRCPRRSSTASRCGSRSATRRSRRRRGCSTSRRASRRSTRSQPVATAAEVRAAIEEAKGVFVEESLNRYVVALLRHTRADPRLYLGASPRSGIALLRVAKARALAEGREYLLPDDVKAVAEHVLAHRLILAPEARSAGHRAAPISCATRSRRRRSRSRWERSSAHDARPARRSSSALGLYVAAWAFGSQPLYPVAVGLAARRRARVGLGAAARPADAAARASRPASSTSRAKTCGRRSSSTSTRRSIRRLDPVVDQVERIGRVRGARCAATQRPRSRGRYVLPDLPRGRYPFGARRAVLEDPFGLERTRRRPPARRRAARLPAPRRARRASSASRARTRRAAGSCCSAGRAGFDLHSVREYEHGESLRKVHWRTTARRGQLMVKELEDAPRDEIAVLLDAAAGVVAGEPPDSSFDMQVRAAGSILRAHARRGRRAGARRQLARAARRSSSAAEDADWRSALELLAAAEPTGVTPASSLLGEESAGRSRAGARGRDGRALAGPRRARSSSARSPARRLASSTSTRRRFAGRPSPPRAGPAPAPGRSASRWRCSGAATTSRRSSRPRRQEAAVG